jgi:GT2 family glycosyltransferase
MADMSARPRVSVLVRSMDRPSLDVALDAIARQRCDGLEVVVVAASGPGHRPLPARCGPFPLRQLHPATPLARSAAANALLSDAAGEWLLFLDDDDTIDSDHIGRLLGALQAEASPGVAYAGVRLVDAQGRSCGVLDEPFDPIRLWLANYLPIHAVMFSRRFIDAGLRFDEELPVYEDWDFWQQLVQQEPFLHVPGVSATYRLIGDSGLSQAADPGQVRRWREAVYRKWLPRLDAGQLERLAAAAEHLRGDARAADEAMRKAQADFESKREEASGLHEQLERAQHARAEAERLHAEAEAAARAARDAAQDALQRAQADLNATHSALATAQAALHDTHATLAAERIEAGALRRHAEAIQVQLKTALAAYVQLEQGYRQVTASLSWRVTAPLRWTRGWTDPARRTEAARRLLRGASRRLPVSPRTRQLVKVRLASSAWGAPLLGWLAPPPAAAAETAASAPSAPPPLDKEAVRAEAERSLDAFLESRERLVFAAPAQPVVSVVVVLYNQAGLSLLCLQALAELHDPGLELIIVDNASSDRMPQLLSRIHGAKLLRQSENLGFLRAVNLAAAQARGKYLLLLNNDAVVFPETIARAVARLDAEPDAGAVGGPILLWDGRLQEAGSIVWNDGSCLGYGRGESPDAGPYRYLRDVDYCSGAFLMVRRALFERLGRFDEVFAPAYYEESDFCVRLWEAGHRIVYDPAVRVRHFEFASDAGSGRALALQVRNRERFVSRHPAFLTARPAPDVANLLQARERLAPGTRRVLFIDDRVPLPWLGQGYPRAASFVRSLVDAGAAVTHYPLQFPHEDWNDVYQALPERCEVMLDHGLARIGGFLEARAGLYDTIVVSRPHNMEVIDAIRARQPAWFQGCRVVYDAEALFSLRDIEKARVLGAAPPPEEQQRMIDAEMALARGADGIVTVSEAEARHFREAGHARVHVLGHAVEPCPTANDFGLRRGFLFVGAIGADDTPNTDSLLWFVRECWPELARALGDKARLDIVGPCDSESVRALASTSIRVHGRVEDLAPFFERARVFIVPTRFAAGIPHKAHEAAARGLPMVVSPLIGQQLGWKEHVPAGATPTEFSAACVRLHQDAAQWLACRAALLRAVEQDCSPAAFAAAAARVVGLAGAPAVMQRPLDIAA